MKYTLAFDVYGTLINTSGVFNTLQQIFGNQATLFMETWRNKQLEYSFRRGLMEAYTDFSVCTKDALNFSCNKLSINLTNHQKEALLHEYTILPSFSDVADGLDNLKQAGHKLFAFSNGSEKALTQLLTHAQIINKFDGIVSVEKIRTFKPNPLVYTHFNKETNSSKADSWLISSNPFDVLGALSYGMRSAWIQRTPASVFDPWGIEPTAVINTLTDLSSALEKTNN
ncbi:haloacid dehalogenase type II [Aureibaculum sp. A20]|uniref:Haloacid dehalogenase type II n=1 Tax=Aureibaculum flavum TaxID=2795986 RepID=A0ABS0WV62_9FLAO|nr:haloacid dehalogenase type II [Aureibaculum flavum]MBJ2175872.1 haloacid dehalogenase type II [Aureibaculum flavum]